MTVHSAQASFEHGAPVKAGAAAVRIEKKEVGVLPLSALDCMVSSVPAAAFPCQHLLLSPLPSPASTNLFQPSPSYLGHQTTSSYEITVVTSDVRGAATDGAVFLTLNGDKGSTQEVCTYLVTSGAAPCLPEMLGSCPVIYYLPGWGCIEAGSSAIHAHTCPHTTMPNLFQTLT